MGMGEPLANYRHLGAAIERLQAGMGLSTRHITISTVGLVPGIRRLAEERLRVGLAVSLHAANDALRDRLVPVNRRYPLATLMDACRHYRSRTRRRVSFEWALMDQLNDSPSDAAQLAQLARPLGAHINLIPLNPTPGWPVKGTPPDRVRAFQDALAARSVNATVRRNRGTEIDAACGQLAGRTSPADDTPMAQSVK
jgi:23S rRNA (adenine2503-C2)-methyltransferase